MITITKERLLTIKEWRETYGPGSNVVLPAEEAEELARIALASLEAEPVAECIVEDGGMCIDGFGEYVGHSLPDGTHQLYTAPPAPVVPEEKPMPNPLSMYAVDAVAAIAEVRGWNACRAAMLHAGNFRKNANSSTNNFREIAETSTNSPVIPGEVLSAILKFARVRADFDDFDGDRRGIGDCLDEAEQELIVTINKYASQLAAEPIATNDVREQQTAVPPIQADVAQAIENLKQKLVECNRYNYCADAVKGVEYACHAAMLQGSQPVSQSKTYRLDFGQWLEQQRGKIDVDCGCVSTETFMHWLRVAYEAGNYPDIPDSSVPAPGKGVTGERIRIKPHVYRELVNRLHDTAIKCAGTQQLRERISRVLGDVITPYHHKQAEKSGLERCHLEAALNIKPGHTLGIIDALLVHKMARALLSLVDAGDTSEGEV
ncbi:hypothetical protein AUP97_12765 [Escherichia coli]|nr:hypothetical protein AUP97_12765 [Escherichia coli]